jgi:hypothetical protein
VEQLLSAQQTVAAALTAEYKAEADYNSALAAWQFAKGAIMQYDNVNLAEGPLPEAARIRATDHFRERNKALLLRERPVGETGPAAIQRIELDPLYDVLPPDVGSPQSVPQMMRNIQPPAGPAVDPRKLPPGPINPISPSATGLAPQPPWLGSGVTPVSTTSYPPQPVSPYTGAR